LCKKRKRFGAINLTLFIICLKFYWDILTLRAELDNYLCISEKLLDPSKETFSNNKKLKLIDLEAELESSYLYSRIVCRESAKYYETVSLCMHDLRHDVHVSGSIMRDGVWEPHILSNYVIFYNYFEPKRWIFGRNKASNLTLIPR
jgi:hypothetical protein